jgi:adenine-specific DNA-methyltransferase
MERFSLRYLGNKASILSYIEKLLESKDLLKKNMAFFDAFCGTGSVADYFKQYYDNIIINDNLTWSVIYTKGRIVAKSCSFNKLGFDPFDFFNSNSNMLHGFMYENYSPAISSRMYFSIENAARIDYFRWQIEEWKIKSQINDDEYCYLLACLIESVSDVSNTAGVYGAFLKKWDPRALKPITFKKVDSVGVICPSVKVYNSKIEDIISDVECDILYLDPPYTQNQYGTQYHLLETLVLDDRPSISTVTGSRKTAPMRSDWSKDIKSHILLDRVIAKTKAKHIVLSYNNDGFMSKDFIEASLKRYGKPETFICKKISYKKYKNWKSANKKEHFEYLFYIEKRPVEDVTYESPLNYIGSKARIINQIKAYSNIHYTKFLDVFGGGFNVGINMGQVPVIYNDINWFVKDLIESFKKNDTYDYILFMRRIISKFGLEKANAESYQRARDYYNSFPIEERDPRLLFVIILYGYQQQIRFNGSHEFNNPVGMRWFNDKVLEKMVSFSRVIKEGDFSFYCDSYLDFEDRIDENTFVYLDPPYMLTNGSYNDGKRGFKGWNKALESELFGFLNRLNARNVHFMLSYVIEHKGKKNNELILWVTENNYNIIELGDILGISGSRRKEVLIVNYDV